jgi:hypothetical protein
MRNASNKSGKTAGANTSIGNCLSGHGNSNGGALKHTPLRRGDFQAGEEHKPHPGEVSRYVHWVHSFPAFFSHAAAFAARQLLAASRYGNAGTSFL